MAARVFIDTNVLISAAFFGGRPGRVVDLARAGAIHGLTSLQVVAEFRDVASRPRFGFSRAESEDAAFEIASFADVVVFDEPAEHYTPDRDDDPIVLAAVIGGADYIVTGDTHLLDLTDPPVPTVTPATLLDVLRLR